MCGLSAAQLPNGCHAHKCLAEKNAELGPVQVFPVDSTALIAYRAASRNSFTLFRCFLFGLGWGVPGART